MSMRIHKFLSRAGLTSRRHAEKLIQEGKVLINGKKAMVGQSINPLIDQVSVEGRRVKAINVYDYYLVNKPRRVVSTTSDPEGRRTILDFLPKGKRLYPVGRLDFDSEGLILVTNDGSLANKLTHPKYEIEKTYQVLITGHLSPQDRKRLERGVRLSDGQTAPAVIENLVEEGGNMWLSITIHEGRNREVRRMFEVVGHTVLRLIRTKLGPFTLDDLPAGGYCKLAPEEVVLK